MGFLTGKYRPGGDAGRQPPRRRRPPYLDERGEAMLAALDEIAAAHAVEPAAVALAWLAAQPTVLAPIASARTVEQVAPLIASLQLMLTDDELPAPHFDLADPGLVLQGFAVRSTGTANRWQISS